MTTALYALAPLAQRDWDYHMDIGDGWWLVMMLGMLTFWVAVAVAVVWAARGLAADRRPPRDSEAGDSALAILDRTLAEGKISVEDYERRRTALTAPPSGGAAGGES